MIQSVQRWAAGFLAVALLGAVGMGCAQDVGDIDRTQPDKVKKSLFEDSGEWYYNQTVSDTDFQGSIIFKALESPLKRIRWEVTEDFLYAYSTVDPVEGLTDEQQGEDGKQLGAVAVFPIQSHFDVQRQYNLNIGEPTNVIVENRSDRPWFQREFMRVDWSANLVDGARMFGSSFGLFSSVAREEPQQQGTPVPDRTEIGKDYIDASVAITFQPDPRSCALNLGFDSLSYCEGGQITARNSFVRIDDEMKNDNFEPMRYTDNREIPKQEGSTEALKSAGVFDFKSEKRLDATCNEKTTKFLSDKFGSTDERCRPVTFDFFSRFGFFRDQRIEWNPDRPTTDPLRKYYANKWDIWTSNQDGELVPKPIVFHLNNGYPKDMMNAADEVESQWDYTFKKAIKLSSRLKKDDPYESIDEVEQALANRYDQAKMFRIDKNSCHPGPLAKWKANHGAERRDDRRSVQQIFTDHLGENLQGEALEQRLWNMPPVPRERLCEELEWATETRADEEARFEWEQIGDLRYSFFNWVRELNGFWSGYGPSASDPLTGEIISADANYAGTPLDRVSTYAVDLVKFINGEITNEDLRFGTHVKEHLNQLKQERRTQSLSPDEMPEEAQREFARRAGHDTNKVRKHDYGDDLELADLPDVARTQELGKEFLQQGVEGFKDELNRISRNIERTKETTTQFTEFYEHPRVKEMMMRSPNFQMMVDVLAEQKYGPDPGDDAKHQAYLDLATPGRSTRQRTKAQEWLRKRNIMSNERLMKSVEGLITYRGVAEAFEGMERSEIRKHFRENIFIGTQLHEVGHAVGLRHNFEASMDALNWHDAYWNIQKLRAQNEDVVREMPENQQEAQSKDPVYALPADEYADQVVGDTNNRRPFKILSEEEFKQASVMDYTADLTGRFAGLGKYDQAAINFVYARHIQRWKDSVQLPNDLQFQKFQKDYTQLPVILGEAAGVGDNETQQRLRGIEIIKEGREWIPIDEAMDEKRKQITESTKLWQNNELDGDTNPRIDRFVDYRFCTDDRASYALGCNTGDHGGNHTEIVNHTFNTYRFFQPFWRYRGQDIASRGMNAARYINRVSSTLEISERPFRFFSIFEWFGIDLEDRTADLQRASIDALNFYGEIMAMPEPGPYCKYTEEKAENFNAFSRDPNWNYNLDGTYVPASWYQFETDEPTDVDGDGQADVSCERVQIQRGAGQFYNPETADSYEVRFRRIGSFYDKLIASRSFFNISANWVNSAFITDSRTSNITFYSLFQDEMIDWMGDIIKGRFEGFAGSFNKVGGGNYQPPTVVEPNKFGVRGQSSEQSVASGPAVMAQNGFNQELNSLAGAMLTNTSWLDQSLDFDQFIKVVNQQDDRELRGDVETAEFVHPVTSEKFMAPKLREGDSISVDIVERGNELKQKWKYADCLVTNFEPRNAGAETYDTQYLEDQCNPILCSSTAPGESCDANVPNLDVQDPDDGSDTPSEKTQERRNRLEDFRETRKRQMEDVVAKLTLIRDVNELVDLE